MKTLKATSLAAEPAEVDLSIVSPVYHGEAFVRPLVERIKANIPKSVKSYEIVLVDDGSPDASWKLIEAMSHEHPEVRGIKLSRNFGQHSAITAGFRESRGQRVILMDCDLQDDPMYIPTLLAKADEGFDIVCTKKKGRAHPWLKTQVAKLYYFIFNWLVGNSRVKGHADVGAYSLLSRKVVDAYLGLSDYHRHYLPLLAWLGFDATFVDIEHRARPSGKSSYSFHRLVIHALDGVTAQSNRLLYLSVGVGAFFLTLAFLGATAIVVLYFIHGFKEGWASVVVSIFVSTGVILMALGIVSVYLAKTFDQVKNRPLYIVDRKTKFENA